MIDPAASGFYTGDNLALLGQLPDACVQMCVTSPPYWGLRSYLDDDDPMKPLEIGCEETPEEYVERLVAVFAEVRRVLKDDGVLWLNLGDSYSHGGCGARDQRRWPKQSRNDHMPRHKKKNTGLKPKDLVGIPWRIAFALRDAGWWLRQDIIWHKPNPMPESVTDRCARSHEYLFLFAKSEMYYYDVDALREPQQSIGERHAGKSGYRDGHPSKGGIIERSLHPLGANKRSVWTVAAQPYEGAHFAVFPPDLIEPCILATSRPGDVVLDPFFGSGTTGQVAEKHERRWIGFDLNPKYAPLAKERTAQRSLPLMKGES